MIKLIPGTLYPIKSSKFEYVKSENGSAKFIVGNSGENNDNFIVTEERETNSIIELICFDEADIIIHISKRLDGQP